MAALYNCAPLTMLVPLAWFLDLAKHSTNIR